MTDEDWHAAIKDAKPLAAKPRHVPTPTRKATKKTLQPPRLDALPSGHLPSLSIETPSGISRGSLKRLKRGTVEIDYTLDLHGYTQEKAHAKLLSTLARVKLAGGRVVLVITGKGRPDKESVLRQGLQKWVNADELRAHIISITQAPQHLGGTGAFLLYLKA